jgi:cytochrome P450
MTKANEMTDVIIKKILSNAELIEDTTTRDSRNAAFYANELSSPICLSEATSCRKSPWSVLDMTPYGQHATLDIIGLAGMGYDFNTLQDPTSELATEYQKVFTPSRSAIILGVLNFMVPRWVYRHLPFERTGEIRRANQIVRRTARDLIARKRLKNSKDEKEARDIISIALESGAFDDENLVDQLMTFLAAGYVFCLSRYLYQKS